MYDLVKMTLDPEWLKENKLKVVDFRAPRLREMFISTKFEILFCDTGAADSSDWDGKRFIVCPIGSKKYPLVKEEPEIVREDVVSKETAETSGTPVVAETTAIPQPEDL